jgi:hypothetical protein
MAAMYSDDTTATHSSATSVSTHTAPSLQSDETALTYSDKAVATHSQATSVVSVVETAFIKEDDTKDNDSVFSLSDMSDTEIEKLNVVMEHPEKHHSDAKAGK